MISRQSMALVSYLNIEETLLNMLAMLTPSFHSAIDPQITTTHAIASVDCHFLNIKFRSDTTWRTLLQADSHHCFGLKAWTRNALLDRPRTLSRRPIQSSTSGWIRSGRLLCTFMAKQQKMSSRKSRLKLSADELLKEKIVHKGEPRWYLCPEDMEQLDDVLSTDGALSRPFHY